MQEAMSMAGTLTFKVATEQGELEQIHRLNYETFVEEIPQHKPNPDGALVDKFHRENTYIICKQGDELLGMLAVRGNRPFSLDEKVANLDSYLPSGRSACEIRLLAVRKECRYSRLFRDLIAKAVGHCRKRGYDLVVVSAAVGQKKLYEHLGFVPFGPVVGSPEVSFQPMYLTTEAYDNSARQVIEPKAVSSAERKMFLLPGPVEVSPDVQRAFSESTISHRAEDFLKVHRDTKELLCRLVNAKNVEIFMGTGTLANDVIAAQLSLRPQKGLILSNGEFGWRIIGQAKRFSLFFESICLDWGSPFEAGEIRKVVAEHPDIKWVWAVHCETSTGILNDIAMLKDISSERGIQLCLDCVSSIGTAYVDLDGVHLASAVSGKGLRSYAGLSMVFYEQKPPPSAGAVPAYLDLAAYCDNNGVPYTVCSNLICAMHKALLDLDIDRNLRIVAAVSAWLKDELRKMGLTTVISDEHANPFIITVGLPGQFNSEVVGSWLESKGCFISYRSRYLLERNWIQICLIGDFSREALTPFLSALREALSSRPVRSD
jgi:aspartate aminotransferase-like enzyme